MLIDKNITVDGYKIWDLGYGSFKPLKEVCRRLATESCVLLKNEYNILPFKEGEKIAVFGRIQLDYYKSGTGSGGAVKAEYIPSITEALEKETSLILDQKVLNTYKNWVIEHPFDKGSGWAKEHWCQEEMPLDDVLVENASKVNSAAVVVIGRTAGEDKDNADKKGSFRLTEAEELMLETVCSHFKNVVVLLNTGNIIDISFLNRYNISALMYVWQGGQEGANAVADLISGKASPSGKLTSTQAFSYEDYPSYGNFSGADFNVYEEDIYVGYRYFETFAKEKVLFPFGFGLSYTNFDLNYSASKNNDDITVTATVKNIGEYSGKEVVQIYFEAPQGVLGKPKRQLLAFGKTRLLAPGEVQTLEISFKASKMASYDDSGVTGNPYCYVLESGEYGIFAGTDVRKCEKIFCFNLDEMIITEKLCQVMAPTKEFKRRIAKINSDGCLEYALEDAPKITYDIDDRTLKNLPNDIEYAGDRGIKLIDVVEGKNTYEEFVAQLDRVELCHLVNGEGMASNKVKRGGTGGAIGGTTPKLAHFGIPVVCVTDGPAGLRFEGNATSIPIGTALASTWNQEGVEEMATLLGIEIFANDVDNILGPGLNIQRDPLCGRNFEYFSEDPVISGKFAAALTRGVAKSGASTTIKHFAANNQEWHRYHCDSVVSERALREIYLKGFEIAVKESPVSAVMTSYNPINGTWTASNYDLVTVVLRNEWGYKGFVMTDWWTNLNWKTETAFQNNLKTMVRAQNDIYMVCPDATNRVHNIFEGLDTGFISIGELQRNVINILKFIVTTPTFQKFVDGGCKTIDFEQEDESLFNTVAEIKDNFDSTINIEKNSTKVLLEITLCCDADSLAQYPVYIKSNGKDMAMIIVNGTDGKETVVKCFSTLNIGEYTLSFEADNSVRLVSLKIKKK